jgi:hypothetical protein
MKNKKKYLGGLKNVRGEKQIEAVRGRDENVAKKAAFKSGPQARTDLNAGRVTPLIPSHQVPVKRGTKTVHREGTHE